MELNICFVYRAWRVRVGVPVEMSPKKGLPEKVTLSGF